MRKIKIHLLVLSATLLSLPSLASAQVPSSWKPLIVCGDASTHPCKFGDVILFINNFINDLILLSFPVAAIAFAWAGTLILTSGGSAEKMKKGRGILIKVAIGYAIIIGSFVVVHFITNTFLDKNNFIDLLSN